MKSQRGYINLLPSDSNKTNILYFASYELRRVVRSVFGADIYAFADGFEFAFTMKKDLEKYCGCSIPIQMLTDSKCLLHVFTKLTSTNEIRLMIYISFVQEAYRNMEVLMMDMCFQIKILPVDSGGFPSVML